MIVADAPWLFFSRAPPFLPPIVRWAAPMGRPMGLTGAFCGEWATVVPPQAGARANIRLMFQAMVTSLHSPRALSSPRMEN